MIATPSDDRRFAMELSDVEQLLNRVPAMPFFAKDLSLRYIAVNDAMLQLCGRQQRLSLLGRRATDVFPSSVARRYEALDVRVLATGQPLHDWLDSSRAADGAPVWLLFSRFPLYNSSGSIAGIVAIARELPMSIRRDRTYQRLNRVARHLQAMPHQPLALRDWARTIALSESQLERDFRKVFGVSPRQFHARARLDLALILLRQAKRIAIVAHTCGYSDHSAFSRKFKSAVGVTPLEYAKAARMAIRR